MSRLRKSQEKRQPYWKIPLCLHCVERATRTQAREWDPFWCVRISCLFVSWESSTSSRREEKEKKTAELIDQDWHWLVLSAVCVQILANFVLSRRCSGAEIVRVLHAIPNCFADGNFQEQRTSHVHKRTSFVGLLHGKPELKLQYFLAFLSRVKCRSSWKRKLLFIKTEKNLKSWIGKKTAFPAAKLRYRMQLKREECVRNKRQKRRKSKWKERSNWRGKLWENLKQRQPLPSFFFTRAKLLHLQEEKGNRENKEKGN